ncbi:adenylate kinase family enzyme [Haloferula luteola]|uniref:Adenylate kinase family enzyme n=1 Tax=Haloferula luteola TaxID=595692 RepID=A0A840UVL8_9BACT|nr:hypothetical protein [Haloferula luteola]MBB5350237.1 adenylate kinase family enzyme [Haloferula luteola]
MKRVSIIGCSGAGKSTFARKLHEVTGLPLVHLDQEFWQPGWKASSKEVFQARIRERCEGDQWIMDGHYFSTLPSRLVRSDTLIFFDYPTWRCLGRTLKRTMKYRGKVRPDGASGCPERWDWGFLRYIVGFRKRLRERTLELIRTHPEVEVHVFLHPRDAARFLSDPPDVG